MHLLGATECVVSPCVFVINVGNEKLRYLASEDRTLGTFSFFFAPPSFCQFERRDS
jgi:hypothetical protein